MYYFILIPHATPHHQHPRQSETQSEPNPHVGRCLTSEMTRTRTNPLKNGAPMRCFSANRRQNFPLAGPKPLQKRAAKGLKIGGHWCNININININKQPTAPPHTHTHTHTRATGRRSGGVGLGAGGRRVECTAVQCLPNIQRFKLGDSRVCDNVEAASPNGAVLYTCSRARLYNHTHTTHCTA